MAWSSPATWVAAAALTAAQLNQDIRDNMTWLKAALTTSGITSDSALSKVKSAVCGVKCTNSADPTHTTATDKTLSWDGESYDTDGFHSTVTNTQRITIPAGLDGTYYFLAAMEFGADAAGDRYLWIENSAGTKYGQVIARATTAGNRTGLQAQAIITVAAADWFTVHVQQDSGSTLTGYQNLTRCTWTAVRLFAA